MSAIPPRLSTLAVSLVAISLGACAGERGGSGGAGGRGPSDPPPVSTSPGDGGALPFVDPFIGTGDADAPSPVTNGKGGNTFPGAALPFGMVQWSPDTPGGIGGYHLLTVHPGAVDRGEPRGRSLGGRR
jgi:hypothetical protein